MNIRLVGNNLKAERELQITGSKSESNRALILQALYPAIELENLSNSDDTLVLKEALKSESGNVDIHHAGTAMRFLTAYFSAREGVEITLTGSERMHQRPIKLLVDALRTLGADITYINKEGFPPLKIKGKILTGEKVSLEARISSQYISALMLIAPSLPSGLEITLVGKVTSTPYILMTLEFLKYFGISATFEGQVIKIDPANEVANKKLDIESDWSSASYFYSIAALCSGSRIKLSNYRKNSFQGDAGVATIYKKLGVTTTYEENFILLEKTSFKKPRSLHLDLQDMPDLAQTIAVTCLGLGIGCDLQGLHTLKIKETDRLLALKTEIEKLGGQIKITDDCLQLSPGGTIKKNVSVATYNDHRMAMAFAPLALLVPLKIEDFEVVSKSYPDFWKHLETLGFSTETTAG